MNPAFGFAAIGPAPTAATLVFDSGLRAGPAANAGIANIMQWIVGQFICLDIAPDFVLGPVGEGGDLDQATARITTDDRCRGAVRRLIPAQTCDPGFIADEGFPQRNRLADMAAAVRVAFPRVDRHNRAPAASVSAAA